MKGFAGLALVGLVVVIACPIEAGADAVTVTVTIGSDCRHLVVGAPVKLEKSKDDVLVWHFDNKCKKDQYAFVCIKDATGTVYPTPWKRCQDFAGLPSAKIDVQFTVRAKGTAHTLCSVNWPPPNSSGTFPDQKFRVHVVTGAKEPLQCPATTTAEDPSIREVSEIAIDVLP